MSYWRSGGLQIRLAVLALDGLGLDLLGAYAELFFCLIGWAKFL